MWTDRTEILVGKQGVEKLKNAHIAVIGLGGVGGYVAYLLARSGVGQMTIVDFDKVDETNINRQIVADISTIGQNKTEVMKELILKINPEIKVNVFNQKVNSQNLAMLNLESCNFVVDAIDSVQDKLDLICFCKNHDLNIVSAMGAGNRVCIPKFEVTDIYKTSNDGLAKIMRKKLREKKIESLDVVTSLDKPLETESRIIGSISYYPAMCGCVLVAYVIEKLLKN